MANSIHFGEEFLFEKDFYSFHCSFRIQSMISFFILLVPYYYQFFLSMELFSLLVVLFNGKFHCRKNKIYERIISSFSRQKDVLNAREKKMFVTFKHHLQSNVCVKQVRFHSVLFLLSSSLYFRKVCTNHFWQKLLIEHESSRYIYSFLSLSIFCCSY